jgi:hypothetical protein
MSKLDFFHTGCSLAVSKLFKLEDKQGHIEDVCVDIVAMHYAMLEIQS